MRISTITSSTAMMHTSVTSTGSTSLEVSSAFRITAVSAFLIYTHLRQIYQDASDLWQYTATYSC